jgi:hypothetical protein
MTASRQQRLRVELRLLRARYDDGAMPPGVFEAIKKIEEKIAWSQHYRDRIAAGQEG